MSFNQDSAMPEQAQGYNEIISNHGGEQLPNTAPTGQETSHRYNLGDNASWLLRKYVIKHRADGSPYFEQIPSLLATYAKEVEGCLNSMRARATTDDEVIAAAEQSIATKKPDFENELELAGEGREWAARKRVIWPLTDELGQQLFDAISGRNELREYATALVKGRDDNIQTVEDAKSSKQYEDKKFWMDLAMDQGALLDAVITGVDPATQYNLQAMFRAGARARARIDTNRFLTGAAQTVTGEASTDTVTQALDCGFND